MIELRQPAIIRFSYSQLAQNTNTDRHPRRCRVRQARGACRGSKARCDDAEPACSQCATKDLYVVNYKKAHEGDIFMSLSLIILDVFSIFFEYATKDIFIGLGQVSLLTMPISSS